MTSSDWQKVKDIFAEAIELPADERRAFLDEQCSGNAAIHAEVDSLLAASTEPENLIENNIIDLAGKLSEGEIDYSDRHFGAYRIIREIGSGGMGTVFLAERDDGEFTMRVALKIVRQSIADREIIARFKNERQILADLHHPNIASLHDGGVGERGEPFLAMEFVDGEPLIAYADKKKLSIRDRLELFLQVCSAVSYAHRNLVVHRDIKPSNILVTNSGTPKLLDFGLAKTFGTDASVTQTAMRAFTPAYASPEQMKGENITTASDIYSLGVVFYELLSGSKPYQFDNKSYDEILNTLNSSEPQKPSSVVIPDSETPGGLQIGLLKGDLDNIALMAIRKEPERRFKTVDDFAGDIKRHLDGRAVTARPNTAGYLAGKFIRRNKVAVAAAALIVLSLFTGITFTLWQADKARSQRDRAERRFQDVRRLSSSLLFELSPKIEKLSGSVEARELLVAKSLEYLDSLASESQSDADLQGELAAAYEKIGELQGDVDKPNLSDYAGAIASFEKARAIRTNIGSLPDNQLRLAENYRSTAAIRNRQNDVSGALTDAENAKQVFGALLADANASSETRFAAIEADIGYGQIYSLNNQYSKAIPFFSNATASLAALDQSDRRTRLLTTKVAAFLGNAQSWDDQQADGEASIGKAVALAQSLESQFPNDPEVLATVWQVYSFEASIFDGVKPEVSLAAARRSLSVAKHSLELDNADQQARHNLARSNSIVGISLAKGGKAAEAFEYLRTAEVMFNDLATREPRNGIYQRDLAVLYVRMGDTSEKLKNYNDALLKYQNSAVIFEKISNGDQNNTRAARDLAQSLKSVAKMDIALSQMPQARDALTKAKQILDDLKARNALGGFDKQLVDEVDKTLASI